MVTGPLQNLLWCRVGPLYQPNVMSYPMPVDQKQKSSNSHTGSGPVGIKTHTQLYLLLKCPGKETNQVLEELFSDKVNLLLFKQMHLLTQRETLVAVLLCFPAPSSSVLKHSFPSLREVSPVYASQLHLFPGFAQTHPVLCSLHQGMPH